MSRRKSPIPEEVRKRKSVRKWYSKHKDEYNKKRRERYHTDPEYRKRAIKASRETRKRRAKSNTSNVTMRDYHGTQVQVFSIGKAAEQIGRTAWVIRSWEVDGTIPKALPEFSESARFYTEHQVELLKWLSEELTKAGPSNMAQSIAKKQLKATIHERWLEGL